MAERVESVEEFLIGELFINDSSVEKKPIGCLTIHNKPTNFIV